MKFPKTIQKSIEHHQLIPAGAKVVVGVSGGADSVALARAFHSLGISFTAAHLNHQLRGAESDKDEDFVRNLGFPVVVKSVDVRKLAAESGQSLEMVARQARHDFFAEFCEDTVIALAHHADDQAETFLLKLARGAGTEGLGGMAFSQTIGRLRLIRPMLNIPRSKILQWLKENQFTWREDASNSDEAFLRNRVRHTVLPMLERELNPNIRETILRTMDILRAENEWMEELEIGNWKLETGVPLAVRRRGLRKWLFEQGVESVGFDAVEKILELMERGEGTTVFELNAQQRVVVEYGVPRLEWAGRQESLPYELIIEKGTGWRKDLGNGAGSLPAEASVDAEMVGNAPITVRCFEPGDRMEPWGMEGSRKLQDIFTDQKIPRAQRSSIPVVVCRGEIIWIPGYRIARSWAVKSHHDAAVHLKIIRPD